LSANGSFQNMWRTFSTVARFIRAASFFDSSITRSVAELVGPFQRIIASYIRFSVGALLGHRLADAARQLGEQLALSARRRRARGPRDRRALPRARAHVDTPTSVVSISDPIRSFPKVWLRNI
jgi:hypothetical protein